jgi:hypothetical protein
VVIDYSVFSRIGEGIVLLVAGGFITRFFERRARLVVFYGHVGAFQLQPPPALQAPQLELPLPPPQPPQFVHTHAVVIRNNGRAVAQNLHVPHRGLLGANNIHVSVFPQIPHQEQRLPNNTEEIFFPTLPAKSQVTISYLYFPPATYDMINAQIYSDEGPARVINVLPQVRPPKWLLVILWILVGFGAVTVLYFLYELIRLAT